MESGIGLIKKKIIVRLTTKDKEEATQWKNHYRLFGISARLHFFYTERTKRTENRILECFLGSITALTEKLVWLLKNVFADEAIYEEPQNVEAWMNTIKPIQSVRASYFKWNGIEIGFFGEPMKEILKNLK